MKNNLTKTALQVKAKSKAFLLSLSLFLSGLLTNTVYAADPFEKTSTLAQQGITKVQGIGIVTFSLALVITGLIYGLGGREIKATIKKHWLSIAIGIVVVSAGPSALEWFWGFVKS